MRSKAIEFPHPVLNEYSKDFVDNTFTLEVVSQDDDLDNIYITIECELKGEGLNEMMRKELLEGVVRVSCATTSYRSIYPISLDTPTVLKIPKKLISESLDIQALVLATENQNGYALEEFNKDYFGEMSFELRKGDIVASEPGIIIKLTTIPEKEVAGIVLISGDASIQEMHVNYAKVGEENPKLSDYIVIRLPLHEYNNYGRLSKKKHLKASINRFLQASLVLPAIVEAIGLLRREEELRDDPDYEEEYEGTVWAESLRKAIKNTARIDDLSNSQAIISDYALANQILGNVEYDSINNLMQKMLDWSTIRQEDDIL